MGHSHADVDGGEGYKSWLVLSTLYSLEWLGKRISPVGISVGMSVGMS